MKNEKKTESEWFKVATLHLIANKIFCDYIFLSDKFPIEPEHFFEEWISKNIRRPSKEMQKLSWRYFLESLIGFRKFHKLR